MGVTTRKAARPKAPSNPHRPVPGPKPSKVSAVTPGRPRAKSAPVRPSSEFERERAKSFKVLISRDQPEPEQHAHPRWKRPEPQFDWSEHATRSRTFDSNDNDDDPVPFDPGRIWPRPRPPPLTIGQLISDPNNILNLPRSKIIVGEDTDEIIRTHMIQVLSGHLLTGRRLTTLMADGIGECLSLWHVTRVSSAHVSSAEFWDKVGSSKGWLRHLGGRICRDFFLNLCVLYERGSKRTPNNRMMEAVCDLHSTFMSENMAELSPYLANTGPSSSADASQSRQRSASRVSGGPDNPPVLGPLVPITSFGDDDRELRELQAQELAQVGQSSALPSIAPQLPVRLARTRRSRGYRG